MRKYLIALLSVLCLGKIGLANHIAGGDFSVKHVEGNFFEARLILYADCEGNPAAFDNTITIAVFDAVTNAWLPDLSFVISNPTSTNIPIANSCYDTGLCVISRLYSRVVELPDNPNGYYMTWERCCRNTLALNVNAQDQGMAFTVEIPDPALQNSSPEFVPYPADAFLCVNGIANIDFAAIDIDGDSLVYTLITPLRGNTTGPLAAINPNGGGPRPYATLNWIAGYNIDDPVGGDLVLTLDGATGMATAQPTATGFFSLSVLVEEYRDGVRIGFVIREVQIASLVCNIDVPSEILTPNGDTIFDVLANASFCIPIEITDTNEGDTLFVQAESALLDGTILPMANFPDADGFSSITQDFCWTPLCENLLEEGLYLVTLTAFSRGCANEVLVTTKDIYINVYIEEDEPTALAEPTIDGGPGVIIDLYNPATHCFNFVFQDPNSADSIFVVASSSIFDLPNAQSLDQQVDQGKATLPFCWNVVCGDVRDEPYFVDFTVVTTNCEVEEETVFTVPVFVVVPENVPTSIDLPNEQYTFEFYTSDEFCIPVSVSDFNFFDTLAVTASSDILTLMDNPATFEPLQGNSLLEGELCWAPKCNDVRPEPYTVTFTASANSCKTDETVTKLVEIFLVLPQEDPSKFELPQEGLTIEHTIGDPTIDFTVLAVDDNDYDTLTLTASSRAFDTNGRPPVFNSVTGSFATLSPFSWNPSCLEISETPYIITFEVNARSCQKNVSEFLEVEIIVSTPTMGNIEPIRNVFTPNTDGANDFWGIEHKDDVCLLNFRTTVIDRWGKAVFESTLPTFQWDGSFKNGSEAADGTFFYVIDYLYKDVTRSYSGNIQILK